MTAFSSAPESPACIAVTVVVPSFIICLAVNPGPVAAGSKATALGDNRPVSRKRPACVGEMQYRFRDVASRGWG